jgi:hypothetical protein
VATVAGATSPRGNITVETSSERVSVKKFLE